MRWLALSKRTLPSVRANRVQSRPVPTFCPAMNFEPRWRIKMLPAVTNSPPNRFTPSRLLTLSRPLRTLPCPFLCAICYVFLEIEWRKLLRLDLFNLNHGQFLAMTDALMIAFSAFHL